MDFTIPEFNLWLMAPEIFLFLWALVVITFDVVTRRQNESSVGYLALFGLAVAGALLAFTPNGTGFGRMFVNDIAARFFKIIFLGAAFMAIGSSFSIIKQKITAHRGEFFGLILLSTVGMMFLASSNELLSLYIGLELTTIPLFVLAAFYKDSKTSVESGVKYFIIGALSSAFLLYGISFLYGISGTTDLLQMRLTIAAINIAYRSVGVIIVAATIMILAGIGFKLALPPFHQWAPDVYEGSPTPVAAFLSVGSKGAGLIAFAKIFVGGLNAFWPTYMAPNDWGKLAAIVAALAMILGNTVAIRQTNIKRMLAYSSIAQAGYVMIGLVAMNQFGMSSMAFYIFAYLFANMGAFAAVTIFEDKTGSCEIASYAGVAKTSPGFAASFSVFLLSLAGIPPLAGFFAKYFVFASAIQQAQADPGANWLYWLVGVGLLTSVFSLYYYAGVIKQMYFAKDASPYKISYTVPTVSVLAIGLAGVFLFGLYPDPILHFGAGIGSALGLLP